ncbi:MAG: hypothetical protein JJU15_09105 [Pararhodobacter sp.]|nr:hypothetical protein [Pararhodobacter sp.]
MNLDTLRIELEHERRIGASPKLSVFRRNATTWELLLLLACEHARPADDGLYGLVERVHTDHLSAPALLKFIRDRRNDGLLHFEPHEKRSKWRVKVDDTVLDELQSHFALRDRLLPKASPRRSQTFSCPPQS